MEMPHCSNKTPVIRLLACLLGIAAAPALAAHDSPYLLGDWGGERARLADKGITLDLGYTSEAAHNVSGGNKRLTRYADQWLFGTRLDLDKLWGWHGASFQIAVTDRNGRNLSADAGIGNYQQVQEIYGRGQTWHLTMFALTQTFFEDKLAWRLGRLPVDPDFATFSCEFQNLTFCGAQPGNLVGDYWVNWPVSQWATSLRWNTTAHTYVKIGAYQLNPRYTDDTWARANGWKPDLPGGTTGALFPLEFGWTPTLRGLPGNYKLGGWYNNAGGENLYYDAHHTPIAVSGEPPLKQRSRYGGYAMIQQQVTGDADGDGINLFFNVSVADSKTSPVDRQLAMGAIYNGPFHRANDKLGAAVGTTHGSNELSRYEWLYNVLNPEAPIAVEDRAEVAAEVFYAWSPVPSFALRPSLQYVVNPGGSTQNRNAFVLGVRTSIVF